MSVDVQLGEDSIRSSATFRDYDSILRELFRLAGPPVDTTLVDAPLYYPETGPRFELVAHSDGKRLRTTPSDIADEFIQNVADHRDRASTCQLGGRGLIGFADSVARELGCNKRFVLAAGRDSIGSYVTVIVAPAAALRELLTRGLLRTAHSMSPVDADQHE